MRRLYNEVDRTTSEGDELAQLVGEAIQPIIDRFHGSGVSIRDIELVACQEVTLRCSANNLRLGMQRLREKMRERSQSLEQGQKGSDE